MRAGAVQNMGWAQAPMAGGNDMSHTDNDADNDKKDGNEEQPHPPQSTPAPTEHTLPIQYTSVGNIRPDSQRVRIWSTPLYDPYLEHPSDDCLYEYHNRTLSRNVYLSTIDLVLIS